MSIFHLTEGTKSNVVFSNIKAYKKQVTLEAYYVGLVVKKKINTLIWKSLIIHTHGHIVQHGVECNIWSFR